VYTLRPTPRKWLFPRLEREERLFPFEDFQHLRPLLDDAHVVPLSLVRKSTLVRVLTQLRVTQGHEVHDPHVVRIRTHPAPDSLDRIRPRLHALSKHNRFDEVDVLASRYLEDFERGRLDRLDVAYTRFVSASKQEAVVETLLPLAGLEGVDEQGEGGGDEGTPQAGAEYEFLPSAESILEEVVPASFKVKLLKCFLDAAVSEQIARMVAMKAATENADQMIAHLSMAYNRARQGQITSELLEIIGGADALSG